jgi:hypothetical protein
MFRKFAAAAVMLLCLAAVATATQATEATEAAPAGLMRRLLGSNTFGHGLGLGGILGGGSAYASASAFAGSGFNRYGGPGYYDPYYARP